MDSINGRTPGMDGKPIKAHTPKNTEISRQTPVVTERFSLFKEESTFV
jgi:DNA (cytosine-5)-methyltransferase 1